MENTRNFGFWILDFGFVRLVDAAYLFFVPKVDRRMDLPHPQPLPERQGGEHGRRIDQWHPAIRNPQSAIRNLIFSCFFESEEKSCIHQNLIMPVLAR